MKLKLTKIITLALVALGASALIATPSYATTDVCNTTGLDKKVYEAAGCNGSKDALPNVITGILNAIIAVAGIVAVIYIVIGGYQYITSTGDAQKVEKAKKTILYALIGLVVCALSFIIVNFVIKNIIGRQNTPSAQTQTQPQNQPQTP